MRGNQDRVAAAYAVASQPITPLLAARLRRPRVVHSGWPCTEENALGCVTGPRASTMPPPRSHSACHDAGILFWPYFDPARHSGARDPPHVAAAPSTTPPTAPQRPGINTQHATHARERAAPPAVPKWRIQAAFVKKTTQTAAAALSPCARPAAEPPPTQPTLLKQWQPPTSSSSSSSLFSATTAEVLTEQPSARPPKSVA